MSIIYKLIKKDNLEAQSKSSLAKYVVTTRESLNHISKITYDDSCLYKYIIAIHEALLIKLDTQQVSILIDMLKAKNELDGSNANDISYISKRLISLLSKMLIGIPWDKIIKSNITDLELCEIVWLIQSQASKCGLIVIDHSGDWVDVSDESLRISLRELSYT